MAGAKRGRKSAWDTRIQPRLLEIAAWARDGHTDKSIYEALDINSATFYRTKIDKSEFRDALRINRAMSDTAVENSLHRRAVGFQYDETVIEVRKDKAGKVISSVQRKMVKTVLPETAAATYWLNNRKSSVWRSTNQVDNTVKMEITDDRTPEQILTEAKIPLPQFNIPNITDMPTNAPTETPETPLQIQAPTQAPSQDIEIARLKAQLASQGKLIEELQKKDELKYVSTDDPENINSPFGKK